MLLVRLRHICACVALLYSATVVTSCGGTAGSSIGAPGNSAAPVAPAPPGAANTATPQQSMVVMVVEENHAYEQVIGNASMPYINSLAQQGAVATQYYANTHPSIGNYFVLTTGATQTNDNNFPGPVSADNLARELAAAGKTWKAYVEDLPSPGYLGSTMGEYIKHHNPFAYFSDVVNNSAQAANIVPFTQFSLDVNAGTLPAFSFIVPNSPDDAHGCMTGPACSDSDLLIRADQWLKSQLGPLLSSPRFQSSGLLLIVFDESNIADIRNGGGRVPFIAYGPRAKSGAQSAVRYAHENTLKTVCAVLGLVNCPGAAASASGEDDLVSH